MKKNLLISTIGVNKNIFFSLKYVVEEKNISDAIYLVSSNPTSLKTYEAIYQFNKNNQISTDKIDILYPDQIEYILKSLDESNIKELVKKIKEEKGKVYLDYTYGTKAMAAGVFHYMVSENLVDDAIYVTGSRDVVTGVVVDNYQGVSFVTRRMLTKKYIDDLNNQLINFNFDQALSILKNIFTLESYKSSLLKNLIVYYQKFIQGDFIILEDKKIDDLIFNFPKLNKDGLKENNILISEYKRLKKLLKKDENYCLEVIMFEIKYLHDITKIYFKRGDYPATLALFVSFLDKYLIFLMISKEIKDENLIFLADKVNFYLKDKKEKEDKLIPSSVGYKLQVLDKVFKNKFVDFKELIDKRNNSLFGHGFYFPNKSDGKKAMMMLEKIKKDLGLKTNYDDYFFYYPQSEIVSIIS
ncbi:MAG: hypothetical protein KatS3mg092_0230 [Patescibacteria group bacterium]|nr:MAG: hypothetical protein KatS3mg092_0230 [Patescibacteria group bacterium]